VRLCVVVGGDTDNGRRHIKDQERRASEREEREQIRARRLEDKLETLENLVRSSKSAPNEVTANPF